MNPLQSTYQSFEITPFSSAQSVHEGVKALENNQRAELVISENQDTFVVSGKKINTHELAQRFPAVAKRLSAFDNNKDGFIEEQELKVEPLSDWRAFAIGALGIGQPLGLMALLGSVSAGLSNKATAAIIGGIALGTGLVSVAINRQLPEYRLSQWNEHQNSDPFEEPLLRTAR